MKVLTSNPKKGENGKYTVEKPILFKKKKKKAVQIHISREKQNKIEIVVHVMPIYSIRVGFMDQTASA